MAAVNEVSQLFSDLDRCGIDGNYIKGLKISYKILEKLPNDKDAFQCKVVCFMQQGKFHDALQILKSSRTKKGIELPFEEAYCNYRLNKTKEALQVLITIEEPSSREKELLAQVYYRLEEYQKCYNLYTDLIKNSQDDFGDERETNLAAVIAASHSLQDIDLNVDGLREDTYELCYNAACLSIAKEEIDVAADKLLRAEELCKKSMEDEADMTEEETESELGVLRVQRGYTYQMQGKDNEAMKLYNQVLKSRPNDVAISAVASNNIVSLNKDRDIFDSKKKIKVATTDGIETKLNHQQRQHIAYNKCLVLMYSNQNDACRKSATELEEKYPESDFPILIQAALSFREKQFHKAIDILETYLEVHAECSMQISLALVQLHLILGNSVQACGRLRSIESISHRPGVVSVLVHLYTHAGDIDAAMQVLDDAVAYGKKNKGSITQAELMSLLRENVAYKLKRGKTKEAVAVLEYLHDLDPNNLKTIAQLVAAYSQIDSKMAEQYSKKLPPLQGEQVDVDSLEVSLGTRYTRKTTKMTTEGVKERSKTEEKQDVIAKRRRKKKTGKLPKNYNPSVDPDPERWLPRRERSYYKGKRQKKAAAVGFQSAFSKPVFVSPGGQDKIVCGNSTFPCRSIRFAVSISSAGDEIHIDYAHGKPYEECEYSSPSIVLNKSISFFGINGKAVIQCKANGEFFKMKSSILGKTRVAFVNLFITRSQVVVRCSKTDFELAFKYCIIKDVASAIKGKGSTNCSIQLSNSRFEGRLTRGISINCINLTAHFVSTSFVAIPVILRTSYDQYKRFQTTTIFIYNCTFDGRRKQMRTGLLQISPYAAIVNITVHSSKFSNHLIISSPDFMGHPTFSIFDSSFKERKATFITLSKLLVENNYNKQSAIRLAPYFKRKKPYEVQLLDSVFRNNSGALTLDMKYPADRSRHFYAAPITRLSNNTFLQNFKLEQQEYGTINFGQGRFHLEFCRFIDNTAGNNLYSALVVISNFVEVTFKNCYYENSQTDTKAIPVYSNPNSRVFFTGNNTFNLIALKTEQAIFIHMPFTSDSSGVILKGYQTLGIFCPPRGYVLNAERQCKVTTSTIVCSYLYYSCRQCPPKTYSLNRGELYNNTIEKVQCLKCPRGGQCENGQVTAKPNFWGYTGKERTVSFLVCPPGYCCDKESCASYDGCHGNRSGPLCGRCQEGMSELLFSTKCKANDECTSVFFWPGVSCFLLLYLLFFLYHEEITRFVRNGLSLKLPIVSKIMNNSNTQDFEEDIGSMNRRHGRPKGSGFLKIIFYYYQIVNLFRNSVDPHRKYQILGNLERTFFRAFNFIVINIPSLGSPFQNVRPVEKTVILRSMGYCLLALVGFLYIFTKAFKIVKKFLTRNNYSQNAATHELFEILNPSESQSRFSVRIASAFTYISLLMYSSSTQLCLSLLHCVRVGDNQVLFIDGNIKCYQTFQLFLVAYVVLSILPFCVVPVLGSYLLKLNRISVSQFCVACIFPLPFCCFWAYLLLKDSPLRHNTVEQDCDVTTQNTSRVAISSRTAILRILLGPFRRHRASFLPWEGLLIFRRLVLIVVVTFIYDSRLKMFIALVICVIILISHMYVKPFTSSVDNFMETLSLGTLIVICGLTLIKAFYQGEDLSSSNSSSALLNSFKMVEEVVIIVPLGITIFLISLSLSIRLMFGLQWCFRVCLRRLGRFL